MPYEHMIKKFIETTLKTNQKLKEYIDTKLQPNDLEYEGTKGHGGDKSLNIDLKAEKLFIDALLPFGDIYSEEIGYIKSDKSSKIKDAKIIIDPLDGSDNFLSGLKYYGTSVALQIDGDTKVGIVYNLVDGSYIYKDEKGFINNQNNTRDIIPKIGIFERAYIYPSISQKLIQNYYKYRSPGAIALSLANAENYNFVLFGGSMREFDLEAALYINNHLNVYKTEQFLLLSKNIKIFNEIKEIIKE